jgi:hypothetical protein
MGIPYTFLLRPSLVVKVTNEIDARASQKTARATH